MAVSVPKQNDVKVVNNYERSYPIVQINIEGESLRSKGFDDKLERLEILRTNNSLSKVVIEINDQHGLYSSSSTFDHGNKVSIFLGYETTTLVPVGQFVIHKHKFVSTGDQDLIKLVAYDKASKLMGDEKSNIFRGKKDSEIAETIAEKVNLEPIITDTEERLDKVTMSNETYASFLKRRSQLYGFQFFVDNNKLYFKKPEIKESSIVVSFSETSVQGERVAGGIEQISMQTDTLEKGQIANYSDININDKQKFSVEGELQTDSVQKKLERNSNRDIIEFDELKGNDAKNHLFNVHFKKAKGPMKKMVDAVTESRSWLVQGEFKSQGLYDVRPGQTLSILSMNRYSGRYYVSQLRHLFDNEGLRSNVKIARSHFLTPNKDYEPSNKNNSKQVEPSLTDTVNASG
jgi:phage protein D